MRASRAVTAVLGLALVTTACEDSLGIFDVQGLWVADSYVYVSGSGQTVDLIERDGAAASVSVDNTAAGPRVNMRFDDGSGTEEITTGVADLDTGQFIFEDVVYQIEVDGERMTMTNSGATFDFGSGSEAATLTIRLTRL